MIEERQTPTNAQTPHSKREENAAIIRAHRESRHSSGPPPNEEPRLHPLTELIKTRLREFYREPAIVFWVFVFPLVMAVGLGAAFRSKPQPTPVIAVVSDGSENGARLADALIKSDRVEAKALDAANATEELARARVDLVVTIGENGAQYRFDPQKESGPVAKLITNQALQMAAGRTDPVATSDQAVTEPGSRYIDFLIPGLIGMNLMGSSMWGVGFNLVVARKRKLLRRYAVTPMRRTHFLLSYIFSRGLFLALELTLLVSFGVLIFGTKIQGSVPAFILLAILGAGAFASISLIIGARLENTETANGWMNFIQMPMYILSGAFFSYERFPEWLHAPIEALPLTAVINALRAIYNEGAGFMNVLPEVAVLSAWALIGFFVALRTFRWQ